MDMSSLRLLLNVAVHCCYKLHSVMLLYPTASIKAQAAFANFATAQATYWQLGWLGAGSVSRAGFHLFYFKQKYQKIWPIDFSGAMESGEIVGVIHFVTRGSMNIHAFCEKGDDWSLRSQGLPVHDSIFMHVLSPFLHIPMLHRHRIYLQNFARLLGCGAFLWNHRLPWSPTASQGLAFE